MVSCWAEVDGGVVEGGVVEGVVEGGVTTSASGVVLNSVEDLLEWWEERVVVWVRLVLGDLWTWAAVWCEVVVVVSGVVAGGTTTTLLGELLVGLSKGVLNGNGSGGVWKGSFAEVDEIVVVLLVTIIRLTCFGK